MNALLTKEFRLAATKLTYFFLAFSLMTFIPGYPILVGGFFVCLGIFYSFQSGREQNDTVYTALLPLPKTSLVQSKFLFTVFIEAVAFLLTGVFTVIRMLAMSRAEVYLTNPMMNANLFFLGGILVIFALFNLIFLSGFFRTGYYFGKPFVGFAIAAFVLTVLAETLHHIPCLEWVNTAGHDRIGLQLAGLLAGLAVWICLTVISYRVSVKRFEKIDL